ncbi:hypothetical protein BDN72DRAFT_887452 [Pluteus cervinus]|uniref:Uncharacterized protein n=1 Tax=Pluteus cervinus TaxID=181527 RepID=A0ACD3B1D3_9AGAR|nr:hypothetical protein BDN72DRAFT_887452 [Pluteus cervinus]
MVADFGDVKVYTVNGATAGSSSSLPDWLTRKRAVKGKGKRVVREQVEGTVELIQGLEFPEASNRIKVTKDGHHVIATGTYKPQMRVWDLDQLTLKFERHSDAENVDFVILSDDWTKSIHLQNDRTIELHTQGGFHYRTRIPKFGRSIAYHFPSCDAYVSASGNEIYRLNLDQGRFMNPLVLKDEGNHGAIDGVNVIDVNPAHQLLSFGVDGNGTVQFWDPRSRAGVGVLKLPVSQLLSTGIPSSEASVSVTAIASRRDGLSYAIGTSTGHTLLYDIRSSKPFATKDQGYGLPIKVLSWIDGSSKMAGNSFILSADKKVIKIWDKSAPGSNFASITPANDLNDVVQAPGSGLLMTANEGIQMNTFYIPQLGPAPRWASFLENITEEMEDQTGRTTYEDFKFVERSELAKLNIEHMIGTPTLRPYMHGYFMPLKLYQAARVVANPFAYEEYREKMLQQKLDKLSESRIRTKKAPGVKVNKALAEKILKDEERAKKREERRKQKKGTQEEAEHPMDVDEDSDEEEKEGDVNLLNDPRFAKVFEDPEFAIDENTREYALLNPSSAAQKRSGPRAKTAVEDEEEESDKVSSDGLGGSDDSGSEDGASDSEDSSDAGELNKYDPRTRPGQKNQRVESAYKRDRERNRVANVKMVPVNAQASSSRTDTQATFGQRRNGPSKTPGSSTWGRNAKGTFDDNDDGGMEVSWLPSSTARDDSPEAESSKRGKSKKPEKRKGVESFGAGLERGHVQQELDENDRKGRTKRRTNVRSGSKNTFRRM